MIPQGLLTRSQNQAGLTSRPGIKMASDYIAFDRREKDAEWLAVNIKDGKIAILQEVRNQR